MWPQVQNVKKNTELSIKVVVSQKHKQILEKRIYEDNGNFFLIPVNLIFIYIILKIKDLLIQ
jgi:hypothetical protein